MKSNSVMSREITGNVITWTYSDGVKLVFDADKSKVDPAFVLMFGYASKIGDGAAIPRNTETGKPATVAEKREAMEKIVTSLYAGEWRAERESGVGADAALLIESLVAMGKKAEAAAKYVAELKPAQRKAILELDAVKKHADKIRRAKVKSSGISGEELLASMPE